MNPEAQLDEILRRLFGKPRKGMSLYDLILAYARAYEEKKIEKELYESTRERRPNKYRQRLVWGGAFFLNKPIASFDLLVSAVKQLRLYHDSREHAKGGRVSDFEKANLIADASIHFEDGLTSKEAWERLIEGRPWLKYNNFCKTYVPHAKNAAKERERLGLKDTRPRAKIH